MSVQTWHQYWASCLLLWKKSKIKKIDLFKHSSWGRAHTLRRSWRTDEVKQVKVTTRPVRLLIDCVWAHIYRVVELGWAKDTSQSEIKTEFQILLLLHQCRRKEHPLSKTQVITSLYNSREICSIHSWKHAAQHSTCTSYDYVKSNRKNK